MRQALVLSMALTACMGGGTDKSGSLDQPPPPTMCDPASQQVGAYLWQYGEVSGTCGPIASVVHIWPDMGVVSDEDAGRSCQVLADQQSDGDCKDAFSWSCTYPDGETWSYTRVLTQEAQDGSLLAGILTEQASGSDGNCIGTYDVNVTRQ